MKTLMVNNWQGTKQNLSCESHEIQYEFNYYKSILTSR